MPSVACYLRVPPSRTAGWLLTYRTNKLIGIAREIRDEPPAVYVDVGRYQKYIQLLMLQQLRRDINPLGIQVIVIFRLGDFGNDPQLWQSFRKQLQRRRVVVYAMEPLDGRHEIGPDDWPATEVSSQP